MKLKGFCAAKETIIKGKMGFRMWAQLSVTHLPGDEYPTYIENSKINIKRKTTQPVHRQANQTVFQTVSTDGQ